MSDHFEISRRDLIKLGAVAAFAVPTAGFSTTARAAGSRKSSDAPTDLQCEYTTDPLGIGELAPRLSWTTPTKSRGWIHRCYQIQVASSIADLAAGTADLWDSGQVVSNQNYQIEYAGAKLSTRNQCYWRVRVWSMESGPTPWSDISSWEVGLLKPQDWRGAQWIGGSGEGTSAPYLRRETEFSGKVAKARLYVAGLGYADIYLNGLRLGGDAERNSAYTDYDKRVLYVAHDVTSSVKSGKNVIGAVLGTGWFDVIDLAVWNFEKAPWHGAARLLLTLVVDYADGRTDTIVTDGSWKTSSGPITRDGIYSGEIYDARLEMPDWCKSNFDDGLWQPATIQPAPNGKIDACPCPPVAVTRSFDAVAITEPSAGVFMIDFGQNLSGHVRLQLTAPAGTTVTMKYGEELNPDGTLFRGHIEQYMIKTDPPQLFQTDTYICKGDPKGEVWEQRFGYSGFRYAEVTGFPEVPKLKNFTSRFAHTDLQSAGDFECSDPMLNKIQAATRFSYLSNAQSIFTDCPQREKNGWTGDAHLAAETGLMNFRSAPLYTKWLNDLADNQTADGQIGCIVPTGGWGMNECHPAWDCTYAFIAWDLYQYLGDTRLLERHYDHFRRYVDHLTSKAEGGLILFDSLNDWMPWITDTPSQFSSTICYYRCAQIVSLTAGILGKTDDAAKYNSLSKATKDAFNAKWFDSSANLYFNEAPVNGGQTAQAMPLFFEMTPEGRDEAVFAGLAANVAALGHIDTGILGAKPILRVLSKYGRSDLAYQIVTRREQPSWAWWMEQGLTTLSEDWRNTGSLNHIMFGDVSNWMIQWIAGIGLDRTSPGFSNILIQPQPVDGVSWARAFHDSPRGRINVEWHKDDHAFHLALRVPANAAATVSLPGSTAQSVMEGGKPVETVAGITAAGQSRGRHVYQIGSGDYEFSVV